MGFGKATSAVPLKDVKDRLRIDGSKDDAELIRLIQDASQWLEDYTGRIFGERTAITEQYNGMSKVILQLRCWPITVTTTFDLRVDTLRDFGINTQLIEDQATPGVNGDYIVDRDEGLIELLRVRGIVLATGGQFLGGFPNHPLSIEVTYSAGYLFEDMPNMVRLIVSQLVGSWYQRFQSKSSLYATGVSKPEGTINYLDGIPKGILTMADSLRTPAVG